MRWSIICWRRSSGSSCLLRQRVGMHHLNARRAVELVDRRHARIGINDGLPGLVVVASLQRDLFAVRDLPALLLDERALERALAGGGGLVGEGLSVGGEACLEGS